MKKHVYNPSGTRQLINSGWKLFDEQTNLITTGNVSSNTQQSSYIRPWTETKCNGRTNPEGHLTNFDLHPFRKYGIPPVIDKIVSDKGRKEPVILYMFHVWSKDQHILPFCWVVTDKNHKLVKTVIVTRWGEHKGKRISAAREAVSYITES